jgi:hypothetical protein
MTRPEVEADMSWADGVVRRASRKLADGETLIVSIPAFEADGRRRRIVLVTDRRVLVVGLRKEPTLDFPLSAACSYDRTGGLLTFTTGGDEVAIRDVDEIAGRSIVEFLGTRQVRRTNIASVRTRPPPEPTE